MQVSVEESSALERRITVAVPEDRIESEVVSRLQRLTRTARIDGFRPGKAPLKVVRRRFGERVRDEVVGEVLRSSLNEAMTSESLKPVGQPVIDPITAVPGEGLSYTATFEIYPQVELAPMQDLQIERAVCDITEADIDSMTDTLREQQKSWHEVERAAVDGDQLTIDFRGTVEGEPFEGGAGSDFALVLGAGMMMDGFEAGLIGHATGDEIVLDLQFPERYRSNELAGKAVQFEIRIKRVSESARPALDNHFFEKFGVKDGGLEAFRKEVRQNMARERDQALKKRFNSRVLDALAAANDIQVPRALIGQEVARLQQQTLQAMRMRGVNPEDLGVPPVEIVEPQAIKRVKVGLVMAEMINQAGLKPDPQKVRATVEAMAASYEDPAAVVKWYYEEPQRLYEFEAMCLEDEAVTWVAGQAQINEVAISFDELMNPRQTGIEAADGDLP